jgi:hypothetical protein
VLLRYWRSELIAFGRMQPVQPPGPDPNLSPRQVVRQQAEQQAEAERMQEVTLLLANLLEREQTTLKAVIGCLYDVGTVNLVNQRVKYRFLRPLARPVLKVSKPVLTTLGYRWVSKKCPPIISRWLQRKVKSVTSGPPPKPVSQSVSVQSVSTVEPPPIEQRTALYQGEIRRLRSRVRWTTAALAGVSATLAIMLIKIDLNPVGPFLQSKTAPSTALVNHRNLKSEAITP